MQFPPIETERLLIRGTKESDGQNCLDIWLDGEMGKYLSDPPKDRADEAELNFAAGIENDEDWYPMVVFKKDTGEFLGTCSIVPADGGKSWDFGYAVHKKFWRQGRNSEGVPVQGYATEILQALIGLGKEKGINIFTAKVAQENEASNAVLKKLGFRISCYSESFRKRNTDIIYPEYTYMFEI